jgi:hypothetical protein
MHARTCANVIRATAKQCLPRSARCSPAIAQPPSRAPGPATRTRLRPNSSQRERACPCSVSHPVAGRLIEDGRHALPAALERHRVLEREGAEPLLHTAAAALTGGSKRERHKSGATRVPRTWASPARPRERRPRFARERGCSARHGGSPACARARRDLRPRSLPEGGRGAERFASRHAPDALIQEMTNGPVLWLLGDGTGCPRDRGYASTSQHAQRAGDPKSAPVTRIS